MSCQSFQREGEREVGEALAFTQHRPRLLWVGTFKRTQCYCSYAHQTSQAGIPLFTQPSGDLKWEGNSSIRGSWVKSNQQERDETTEVNWRGGTRAAAGIPGNLFCTEVSPQARGGWRCREREWSCNARARSKEGALGRGQLISPTESFSSAWGIQGAWGGWAGASSRRSARAGRDFWLQQKWSRQVQSQAAGRVAWQAGSKRKAPWESQDMLMGAVSFRK